MGNIIPTGTNIKLSIILAATAILAGQIQAQTILSVDVGSSDTPSAGFVMWNPTSPNNDVGLPLESTNFGAINLTLNAASIANENNSPAVDENGNLADWGNGIITRLRNPISTTSDGAMYEDFATAASGGALGLEISGLSANTAYAITFYSFDENGSRTSTFANYTGGADNVLGTITYSNPDGSGSGDPTYDSEYSLTSVVTTDSSGRFIFGETEPGNAPILNGFEIAAVPEPGSLSLLLLTVVGWLNIRRRHIASGVTCNK